MLDAIDVARFFLARADMEAGGDRIDQIKLQKLCYYAQGFSLVVLRRPLFPESMEAWDHGPVVRSLWYHYTEYGSRPIDPPHDFDISKYDDETRELLEEVYRAYGQFTSWKLRDMIHREPPWLEAREHGGFINHEVMRKYFKTVLPEFDPAFTPEPADHEEVRRIVDQLGILAEQTEKSREDYVAKRFRRVGC